MKFALAALGCAAVVVVALFLTGAFSGSKPSTPERAVQGFLDAVADGNGDKACGFLVGMMLVRYGGPDCARRLEQGTSRLTSDESDRIRRTAFRVASLDDGLAEAVFPPGAACPGDAPTRARIVLIKVHSAWLLSGPPAAKGCLLGLPGAS